VDCDLGGDGGASERSIMNQTGIVRSTWCDGYIRMVSLFPRECVSNGWVVTVGVALVGPVKEKTRLRFNNHAKQSCHALQAAPILIGFFTVVLEGWVSGAISRVFLIPSASY